MKALVALAAAVVAMASTPVVAASPARSIDVPTPTVRALKRHVPARCTAPVFRRWSQKVWRLIRWERGQPKPTTLRAQRRVLRCAPPGHRHAMQRRWRRDKAAYYRHRTAERAAQRRREALTPYGDWAIPGYIVDCESGGDFGAVNPSSGAGGAYQILPSTWAAYGGLEYASSPAGAPAEAQHIIAGRIWADVGASAWACA